MQQWSPQTLPRPNLPNRRPGPGLWFRPALFAL